MKYYAHGYSDCVSYRYRPHHTDQYQTIEEVRKQIQLLWHSIGGQGGLTEAETKSLDPDTICCIAGKTPWIELVVDVCKISDLPDYPDPERLAV